MFSSLGRTTLGYVSAICIPWIGIAATCSGAKPHEERRPNFILVVCDNLGYGDVEPFGSKLNRTPNLSKMAQQGRKFTHFYVTAGVCTPSRASILTGKYSQRVGMHVNPRDGHVLRPVSPFGLAQKEVTIAEHLQSFGYRTAIVGKWHLGDQNEFLPTRQGFESFFGIPYSDDMTRPTGVRIAQRGNNAKLNGELWPPLPLMENEKVIEAPVDRTTLTKRYTQRAVEFINRYKDEPFFLYLPHAMPGSTSAPFSSEKFRGKSKGGPWGDSVEELDWSMGRILSELERLNLSEDTLVIWTSDNGAPLVSPNAQGANHRGSNGPLHGRGYTTSEGAFRVPMIAWWPGKIPGNSICNSLVTTMDFLPTMHALNKKLPSKSLAELDVDGFNIANLLFEDVDSHKSPYPGFCYYERDQLQAVRVGDWKLFLPLDNWQRHPHFVRGQRAECLLFHLRNDPACRNSVAHEQPKIVSQLLAFASAQRTILGDRGLVGSGQSEPGRVSTSPTPQTLRADGE